MLHRLGLLDKYGKAISPAPPFVVYNRIAKKRTAVHVAPSAIVSTPLRTKAEANNTESAPKELCVTYQAEAYASEEQTPSGNEIAEALSALFAGIVEKTAKTPRDAHIVKQRLGLGEEGEFPTLSDLGGIYNISRERVRQLEKKGINKVYAQLRRNTTYKVGVFLNLSHFGPEFNKQPALEAFIKFLREQISSQAVRIRWGALVYCALAQGATDYKKAELLFLQDYRAHFERLDAEWAEKKRLWNTAEHAGKIQRWWDALLNEIFWPETPSENHFDDTALVPIREPNDLSLGDTTSFWSQKNGRMVMAESDLERVTYDILEATSEVTSYTEQPVRIDYAYESKTRSYYPDIFVRIIKERRSLIEVKDKYGMALRLTLVKALAAKTWAHERGLGFGFFSPRGHSHTKFYRTVLDPEWAKVVLNQIDEKKRLNWDDMKLLQKEWPNVPSDHILSLIIQNDLAFSLRPYSLSRLPENISFKPLIKLD